MKIKNKLRLGFGFLFLIVIFFGAISLYYINQISQSAKVILKDNYNTLRYTREMRSLIDNYNLPFDHTTASAFQSVLSKQEANITEAGEAAATMAIRPLYNRLQSLPAVPAARQQDLKNLRNTLQHIEVINMKAIERKDERSRAAVENATLILGLIATFTFLVLFSFSVNFPGFIANPLRQLILGIQEISQKNYQQRLNFNKSDEFAEVAFAFNTMASRLSEWENSNLAHVLSDKQRIETIIEQMQDAIIGVNEKGEILFINPVAASLLNLQEQQLVGQPVSRFAKSNDLLKSITGDRPPEKPFKIVVNKVNSFFKLEVREITVPVTSPADEAKPIQIANRSAGKVYILRNITEYKELDEAKTNFIATISHELKTPISSVKLSVSLLKDGRIGSLNDEQLQLVQHISDDNERLLNITSELLDLSQVETGNIQLNLISSNPADIVHYAVNAVKFQAEQKQIDLQILLPDDLLPVQVDMEKTAWVLVNFLSNALRYSYERSKVIIEVNKKGKQLIFLVRDFGKGIEEQYQKRLFDRYFQVPTDGQNKSGSGLGLAISKNFIEAQNGTIGVESAIGEGSKFFFSLPAANS